MENTGPIISNQYMTPRRFVCFMLENIHTNLANFLGHHNSILLKNIGFNYSVPSGRGAVMCLWCIYGQKTTIKQH